MYAFIFHFWIHNVSLLWRLNVDAFIICSPWTWAGIPTRAAVCSCRHLAWWRSSEAGSVPLAPSSSRRCPCVTPSWPSGRMVVPFVFIIQTKFITSACDSWSHWVLYSSRRAEITSQWKYVLSKLNATFWSYVFSPLCVPAVRFFLPSTACSPLPPTCLPLAHQRLQFTRPRPQTRRPSSAQPGNWAGFSSPGPETLSWCLSSASLASTSCWPCWVSPARDDACLCWVRAAFSDFP